MKFYGIFILRIALLLAPLLFLKPIVGAFYPEYNQLSSQFETSMENETRIFILGASHASSLDPSILEDTLSMPVSRQNHAGADLFEVMYQIKSIQGVSNRPNVYIVAFSPFMFMYDNFAFVRNNNHTRRENRIRLYSVYQNYKTLINDDDFSNALFSFFHPIISYDHWQRVFASLSSTLSDENNSTIRNEQYYIELLENCDSGAKRQELQKSSDSRISAVYTHGSIPNMQSNAGYSIPHRIVSRFTSLIKNSPRDLFIIYVPPFWSDYSGNIPAYIQRFNNAQLAALESLPNVLLEDYSTIEGITDLPCYFRNSDHLNPIGEKLFTKLFADDFRPALQTADIR